MRGKVVDGRGETSQKLMGAKSKKQGYFGAQWREIVKQSHPPKYVERSSRQISNKYVGTCWYLK